jgi:hypothetical protein
MSTATSTNPVPATPSSPSPHAGNDRLMSLDALRGFDMFWIIGGSGLVLSLAHVLGFDAYVPWLRDQFTHPMWNGFTFYDLIFPLFVFLVGVAMPFSFSKHLARGEGRGHLYWRICRRTVLLVLLGIICNNGVLKTSFADQRFPSVLGRIGLCYFFAALIMLHSSARGRLAWILVLLLGYWAAMTWIPVPKFGAGNLTPGATLADYIDRTVMPGKLYLGVRDPEGLFSTIPAIATALIGVLAGLGILLGSVVPDQQEPLVELVRPLDGRLELAAAGAVLPGDRRVGLEIVGLRLRRHRRQRHHHLRGAAVDRFRRPRPVALRAPRAAAPLAVEQCRPVDEVVLALHPLSPTDIFAIVGGHLRRAR